MNHDGLSQHIARTYFSLRVGIASLGFALPILLWLRGTLLGDAPMLESMSAYYHTPVRDIFVGVLVAVGGFLFLYKGRTAREDWALNFAGVLAIGIALFPTTLPDALREELKPGETAGVLTAIEGAPRLDVFGGFPAKTVVIIHKFCAVVFFLCIAYVCIREAQKSLPSITDSKARERFRKWYQWIGWLMIAVPAFAAIIGEVFDANTNFLFCVEAGAVWVFSTYWLVKTVEFRKYPTGESEVRCV